MPVVKKVRGGDSKALQSRESNGSSSRRSLQPRESSLSLPTKPNRPPSNLYDYIIFLYGDKGVGKSSLAAQFKDSITFMTEPMRRNLPILQIPDPNQNEEPLSWLRIQRYTDLIIKEKRFTTVVFDTVDRAYELCLKSVCERANCTHPNQKNDYGDTWNKIKREYEEVISKLATESLTVVGISHARSRDVTSLTGEEFQQVTPTCPDACWTIWKALSDFAFYYGYKDRRRSLFLRGSDEIWASCGTSENHFLDPKGNLLSYIPAGESPKEAYQSLINSYNNKVYGTLYQSPDKDDEEPENQEDRENPTRLKLPRKSKK